MMTAMMFEFEGLMDFITRPAPALQRAERGGACFLLRVGGVRTLGAHTALEPAV